MMRLYWWAPTRPLRSFGSELIRHSSAWLTMLRSGPRRLANFGDDISPMVTRELTGRGNRWARINDAEILCVGSVINAYVRGGGRGRILGSGVRQPTGELESVDLTSVVLSVRGTRSRDTLRLPIDTQLGDPGLIVSQLLSSRTVQRQGGLLVPHFAAVGTPSGRRAISRAAAAGLRICLPNEPPLEIAEAIRGSAYVLTSSLHGLVFADALGTPAQLVSLAPKAAEPLFKYEDYCSVFGLPAETADFDFCLGEGARLIDRVAKRTQHIKAQIDSVIEGIYRAATPLR